MRSFIARRLWTPPTARQDTVSGFPETLFRFLDVAPDKKWTGQEMDKKELLLLVPATSNSEHLRKQR